MIGLHQVETSDQNQRRFHLEHHFSHTLRRASAIALISLLGWRARPVVAAPPRLPPAHDTQNAPGEAIPPKEPAPPPRVARVQILSPDLSPPPQPSQTHGSALDNLFRTREASRPPLPEVDPPQPLATPRGLPDSQVLPVAPVARMQNLPKPPSISVGATAPASPKKNQATAPSALRQTAILPLSLADAPKSRGTGLLIAGGILYGFAIGEAIAAHSLFSKSCVSPIGNVTLDSDPAALFQNCTARGLPSIGLRVLSDVHILLGIAMVGFGGNVRGRHNAFTDVFNGRPERNTIKFRVTGTVLLTASLLAWLSTSAGAWGGMAGCESTGCVIKLRAVHHALRLTSATTAALGAGMLSYGHSYSKRHTQTLRLRHAGGIAEARLSPALGPRRAGLTFSGRF